MHTQYFIQFYESLNIFKIAAVDHMQTKIS